MKRTLLVVLMLTLVAVPALADTKNGSTSQNTFQRWRFTAPGGDITYETLKEGTNRLVCYDRSDERGRQPFAVQCTSVANLERVAQNRRFRAESGDADAEGALLAAAEANGTRMKPEFGSVWISMNGPDPGQCPDTHDDRRPRRHHRVDRPA